MTQAIFNFLYKNKDTNPKAAKPDINTTQAHAIQAAICVHSIALSF